jgi:hypothetical protein
MKKLVLISAISAAIASPAFAAATSFSGTAKSGTAADQTASIAITSTATTAAFYVDPASGAASNPKTPAIQLTVGSDWSFDFSNPASVAFTGNVQYGDYMIQNNITGLATLQGREQFYGTTQSFSGVGSFNQATNTFTYVFSNATSDGSGGSVESHTSAPTCVNGATSSLGSVCGNFITTQGALDWEGLSLTFVFSADKSSFSGALTGTNKAGSGLTASTTVNNWQIAGAAAAPAVPVPAAAWLFGSGLLGLAGTARRRVKN